MLLILEFQPVWAETPPLYQMIAKENNIPADLFFALTLNESRSMVSVENERRVLPWPWTINHRGKPHYFATRGEAYEYMEALITAGDSRFDVGLGQINWYWHNSRFGDAWEALDPYTNLSVSAGFLREQFDRAECHTWTLAIGCYHRPAQTPADKKIAQKYASKVIAIWSKLSSQQH